jgi:hypothetical protein
VPFLRQHVLWGLIPLAGIGGLALLLASVPRLAVAATDLASVGTPIAVLAGVLTFRWRWLAVLAVPLYVIAWQRPHTRLGELAGDVLIIGACATLAWLTGLVAPTAPLAAGIVLATIVDVYQVVVSETVQPAAQALAVAKPPGGLPRLQQAMYAGASLGWGDVFLAALLGVIVARVGGRAALATAVTFVAAVLWGFTFRVWETIPATVPVCAALVVVGVAERERVRRWILSKKE